MTKEVWKYYKTTNYKGEVRIYEVSNYGRVKCNGELYKCGMSNGYKFIARKPLHRIVAELFIPNPYNLPCVDHINTVKTDNMVWNLRWCTYKENTHNELTINHIIMSNKSRTGYRHTEEEKMKCASYGMKNKIHSEETKQRMSLARKKYWENKRNELNQNK